VTITIGTAQRTGTETPCADGYDTQRTGDQVTAAVVDGAGHHEDTVRYAGIAPAVITHIGATLGGLAALITAGQMAGAYDYHLHLSAIYARAEPGEPTGIHWIGDCRAYGWDGERLTQYSTDQTMGRFLAKYEGVAIDLVDHHDAWARLGLAQATAATCREAEIPAGHLVLLCSDGISDQVDQETAESLCREHATDPQALADALVAAVEPDDTGYRDDATVVVLAPSGEQP